LDRREGQGPGAGADRDPGPPNPNKLKHFGAAARRAAASRCTIWSASRPKRARSRTPSGAARWKVR
jgi:hypothetical protein